MAVTRDFWQGKRVYLTGHTGFKGGWLALWLADMGATVKSCALVPNTEPNFFSEVRLQELIEHEILDIRDYQKLKDSLTDFGPDIVLHLAAQPLVRYSYDEPLETYGTNVMGTANLLEAVRQYGKAKVSLVITSDKCYENKEQIWSYRESDRLGGHDPYSNSKACTELVTKSYGLSYFLPNKKLGNLASVRAGNVIGGGDWSQDRLIPDLVKGLNDGKAPVIRNPHAVRPWQHVLEPLSGYLNAVEYLYEKEVDEIESWNFGPNFENEQNVGVVAKELCKFWDVGIDAEIKSDVDPLHEATLLTLDHTKATIELDWHPVWGFSKTLEQTVCWYKAYYAGDDMRLFSLGQIAEYVDNA